MSWLLFPDAPKKIDYPWLTKATPVPTEAHPFHGILRDWGHWASEETIVDLVAVNAKPPRFPWEVPAAVALIVAVLALFILG